MGDEGNIAQHTLHKVFLFILKITSDHAIRNKVFDVDHGTVKKSKKNIKTYKNILNYCLYELDRKQDSNVKFP